MVRRTEVLQGLRMRKFLSLLDRVEAAEILGMERSFRRWCERYRNEGEAGLADRRLGKPSAKRLPDGNCGQGAAVGDAPHRVGTTFMPMRVSPV